MQVMEINISAIQMLRKIRYHLKNNKSQGKKKKKETKCVSSVGIEPRLLHMGLVHYPLHHGGCWEEYPSDKLSIHHQL